MADLVGRTIGNYVVRREVGRGGMGAVYLAEHPRLRRHVAVKVLHPEMSRDAEMVARFFNEARAASDIRNAHIVDILDFGELPEGTSYLIMEWLEGRTLNDVIKREPALPLGRAAHVAVGVGRALAAAHAHGVVHRDLKPDNIFLVHHDDDPDFVKVLDFGIAKLLVAGDGAAPRTATNVVLGTPAYMSPEQCRGESSTLDGRSDIYSLGVILYELATGRRPFNAETYTGILVAHVTQQPPAPRLHQPAIPEAAERVILRALEKDRDKRYARVEELVNEFAAAVGAVGMGMGVSGEVYRTTASSQGVAGEPSRPGASSGRSTLMAYGSRELSAPAAAATDAVVPPTMPTPVGSPSPSTPPPSSMPPTVAMAPTPPATPTLPTPAVYATPSVPSTPPVPPTPTVPPASSRPSLSAAPHASGGTDAVRPVASAQRGPLVAFAGGGLVALVVILVAVFIMRRPAATVQAALPPLVPVPAPSVAPPAPPAVAQGGPETPAPPRIDHPPAPTAPAVPPPPPAAEPAPAPPAADKPVVAAALTPPAAGKGSSKHGARRTNLPAPSVTPPPPPPPPQPLPVALPPPARPSRVAPIPPPPVVVPVRPADPPAPARTDPPPRRAAEEPADDLDRRLAREAQSIVPDGKRYGPKLSGEGEEGKGQDRFLTLEGGRCYTFITVGTESMGRIYTYLWDPTGKRVATDKPEGLVSTFDICPPVTGPYHFQGKPARGAGAFKTAVYVKR